MFGTNSNELDPISLWVLLLLSGGQRFSIHELVPLLNRNAENIWIAVQTLRNRGMIEDSRGRYRITNVGIEFLAFRGISATLPEDEPEPRDFMRRIRPPFFSSFREMFIWLAAPLIALIPLIVFLSAITTGYNFISLDKRISQASIITLYLIFLAFYIWVSSYNVMESERIVVFRGGRAIGTRGPGRILLLPLIDNPRRVDMRERSREFNREPCITQNNVLINAGFYITWQVDDPIPSLTRVSNIEDSMTLLSAAALRTTIAEFTMESAMQMRRSLNNLIRSRIEQKAGEWGVQVNNTEIRELQPSDDVMRQIENRFSANLESDATLARSNAKVQSLRDFLTIGEGMARNPVAFNLKYLDTLEKIGEGASTKYIIPMEFFNFLRDVAQSQGKNLPDDNNNGNKNNPPEQLPPGGTTS